MADGLSLPKASVRRIMKISDEVSNISAEAVNVTCKATEEFLSMIIKQSYEVCKENNRKTIKIEDLMVVIQSNKLQLEFLGHAFSGSR